MIKGVLEFPKAGESRLQGYGGKMIDFTIENQEPWTEDDISKAIQSLKANGYLTRDPRMVERKKYGQRGARRKFQFSKR